MVDMDKTRSLVAFVGMRDPYPEHDDEPGPLLSLLVSAERSGDPFHEAWLLCSGGTFLERARDLEREARDEGIRTRFLPMDFPVRDVIDYREIWGILERSLKTITEKAGTLPRDWAFLLDSGTPQMKTSLFLAARSGLFPARLIQGIPPRFAGGAYKSREVQLDGLPDVSPPGMERAAPRRRSGERIGTVTFTLETRIQDQDREAPAFAEARRKAMAAARYDDPVLLLGETGTGKTMLARQIHAASPRSGGPFVEVNCSAIAGSMAESELFGHAKGSFTGADKARSGKFRAAEHGTLFLDEVGDLSLEVQAKLLKALEQGAVTPVGADSPVDVDVRLVAATNRDLPAMIKSGAFRRDLYERLKVVVVTVPPLRERREDIRALALRFIDDWNGKYDEERYLTEEVLTLLESYSWPGNVRELNNSLKSAASATMGAAIGPESLPMEIVQASGPAAGSAGGDGSCLDLPEEGIDLKARLLQLEWEYVSLALRRSGGNREAAAKLLGLTGHAFRKSLRERFAFFLDEGWDDSL